METIVINGRIHVIVKYTGRQCDRRASMNLPLPNFYAPGCALKGVFKNKRELKRWIAKFKKNVKKKYKENPVLLEEHLNGIKNIEA